MNVLYISYDGMTDPLGQSQVIPYLVGLSRKGHRITLIACEKKERFEQHQSTIAALLTKANIQWCPVPYSTLPSVVSKRLNIYKIKKAAVQHCKTNKADAVHCRSYMAALIGLYLKKKFKIQFIFDMRGFWADERIDGKIWDLNNTLHNNIYKYFKKKEIEFLTKADYTITLTQHAKAEIMSWKPFQHKSLDIQVIPCCADLDLFSMANASIEKKKKLREQLKLKDDDFIVTYLGSIGTWYMLDEMLDFFVLLIRTKKNARFLFISPDSKAEIEKKAQVKGIDPNRITVHSATRAEVPIYLSLSNVSIYFIKPLYSKKASSPTKTGEIMGMGIPIITNSGIGDSDQIITDSGAGLLINCFTNEEYQKIIEQIDVLLKTEKTKITAASAKYFSLENGIELYQEVYKQLEQRKE